MRDTIVIGAGLSGLMGALALAEDGARPLLLAKGQGTTHWTPGTIDLWGVGTAGPRATIAQMIAERPEHPYALAGLPAIERAVERFLALVRAARYPYVGSYDRNLLLPTALGALRPAAFVPATMAAGDIRLGGEILIAGFRELRDFFPPLIAENLSAQGIAARGVYLTMPQTVRRLEFTTRNLAQLFDQPAFRQDVGRQLREQRGAATRIGMPAVLGLRDPLAAVAELQNSASAQIFEIGTLPPSVPGLRLFTIFAAAIEAAGGQIQLGSEVLRSESEGRRLTAVFTEAAARQQRHSVGRALLASGGIAGGGVRTDHTGAVWETALGLPLRAPDSRGEWFATRALSERGHPIFAAGVVADAGFRPLDGERQRYGNVAVAGGALGGADSVRERSRSGVAIVTGHAAATALLEG